MRAALKALHDLARRSLDCALGSPMKTTWGWSAKLTRTIVLKDGTRLATPADVRTLTLTEPKYIQERGSWQHSAELMILAAERGGSIEAATTQIEDALFLEPDTCGNR